MRYKVNMKIVKPRSSARGRRTVKAANATKQIVRVRQNNPDLTESFEGGNLYRFVYNRTIEPGSFLEFTFDGRDVENRRIYKPVSGGWWAHNSNHNYEVYVTTNYSSSLHEWTTILYNSGHTRRDVRFVIIARRNN